MEENQSSIDLEAVAQEMQVEIRALPIRKTANVRAVRRRFSKRLAKAAPQEMIELSRRLSDDFGLRFVAYELVHHHEPTLRSLAAKELEQLGRGIDSWAAVDTFASYLSGPAWRAKQVPDELIHEWARSENRWWRRAALVSTVPLNVKARGGSGDAPRTLEVCRMLVADRDDLVVKALSWALRALVQHDPDSVGTFLTQHEDALAARVKREGRNKLTTGLKNPRQK